MYICFINTQNYYLPKVFLLLYDKEKNAKFLDGNILKFGMKYNLVKIPIIQTKKNSAQNWESGKIQTLQEN